MNSDTQAKLLAHGSVMLDFGPAGPRVHRGELYALVRTRNL
jgi:hypothetical protein